MSTSPAMPSQTSKSLRLSAEFIGLPHKTRLTRSDFYLVPFHDDQDFESFEILGRQRSWPWPKVLLNYTQKDQLLSSVLGAVRECCKGCDTQLVLNSRMPSTTRIPAAMLGDDVFVVIDVEAEAQRYLARGRSVITLQEGLIRYATESGANELLVTWYLAPADGAQRLQALGQHLQAIGFALREDAL